MRCPLVKLRPLQMPQWKQWLPEQILTQDTGW